MQLKSKTLNPPPGSLPARMRALFVSSESQDNRWLSEAFAADCASVVALQEAMGAEAALFRLRDEVFDAIVLRHIPGLLDALELCEAIRELGVEEPVLVLGDDDAGDFATLVYEIGGDAYLCTPTTSTRASGDAANPRCDLPCPGVGLSESRLLATDADAPKERPQRHGRSVNEIVFVGVRAGKVDLFLGEHLFDARLRYYNEAGSAIPF